MFSLFKRNKLPKTKIVEINDKWYPLIKTKDIMWEGIDNRGSKQLWAASSNVEGYCWHNSREEAEETLVNYLKPDMSTHAQLRRAMDDQG